MTDEQLRAMARRVLGLVSEVVLDGRPCYVGYRDSLSFTRPIEEVDAEAVAIMREEMAKAQTENYAMAEEFFPFIPHPNDDPTQAVSIDT